MKILLIISSLSAGGAEKVLVLLSKAFIDKGMQVYVTTIFGKEKDFYNLPDNAVRFSLKRGQKSLNLLDALMSNFGRLVGIKRVIKSVEPEIIVSFMPQTNILTLISAGKIPVIITEHSNPNCQEINLIWNCLRRLTYNKAAKLICVSSGVLSYFQWIEGKRKEVIGNPVDYKDDALDIIEYAKKNKIILAMGRLTHFKGFDLLIKAFSVMHPKYPDWKLVILGEGKERNNLEQLSKELGLINAVSLPGAVEDTLVWLKKAAFFILSSRYEGFGNVIIEAMACGTPVISFDCPCGPGEIITHGVNGLLVSAQNIDLLSEAMEQLILDQTKRDFLANNAKKVVQRYGLKVISEKWMNLFNEISRKK